MGTIQSVASGCKFRERNESKRENDAETNKKMCVASICKCHGWIDDDVVAVHTENNKKRSCYSSFCISLSHTHFHHLFYSFFLSFFDFALCKRLYASKRRRKNNSRRIQSTKMKCARKVAMLLKTSTDIDLNCMDIEVCKCYGLHDFVMCFFLLHFYFLVIVSLFP